MVLPLYNLLRITKIIFKHINSVGLILVLILEINIQVISTIGPAI